MADLWDQILLEGSYSGERIDILSSTDDLSRAIVSHEYPHVDGGDSEDMGRKLRRTECRIAFFPTTEDADPRAFVDRFNAIVDAKDDGDAHVFVHPLLGSYIARIENFRVLLSGEERDYILVECTFVEDSTTTDQLVIDAGSGSSVASGVEEVTVAAAGLAAAIADYNSREGAALSTTIGATATATVTGWQEAAAAVESGKKTLRDLRLEMETVNGEINDATDELELTADPKRWPIYNSMNLLAASVMRAFDAATAVVPQIFDLTIQAAAPLIAIAARVYGAELATERADELRSLNDIRNPAYVPAGTILKAFVPTTSARRGSR